MTSVLLSEADTVLSAETAAKVSRRLGVRVTRRCGGPKCSNYLVALISYPANDSVQCCSRVCAAARNLRLENEMKDDVKPNADGEPKKKKKSGLRSEDAAATKKKKKKKNTSADDSGKSGKTSDKKSKDKKNKKAKELGERVPRTSDSPYTSGLIRTIFDKAKDGIRRSEIERRCEEAGIGVNRVIQNLRAETYRGWRWRLSEEGDGAKTVFRVRKVTAPEE